MPAQTFAQTLKTNSAGAQLLDGQDILDLASELASGSSGITAKPGGGTAGAPLLKNSITEVSTVATAGDSVILPYALAGQRRRVINSGAASLTVAAQPINPNTGKADSIVSLNGTPTGGLVVPSNAVAEFWAPVAGKWKSVYQ